MLSKEKILATLSELKPFLQNEFSVKNIGLFGSFADGVNTADSDIDLLVEFDKPIRWMLLSLEIYFEELFKRKIDLVSTNALRDQILKQVQFV
jgi:hypothetical protein